MRAPRVAVMHQAFVPHYRVRFFELLAERPGVEYVVIHGDPPSGQGHTAAVGPFRFPNIRVRSREIDIAGRGLILQDVRPILSGHFDALVLGTHLLFPANHLLFGVFRAAGRPVLYWGHGRERAEPGLKRRLARLSSRYLAYSAGGAEWLAAHGVDRERIDVVRNTLDMAKQIELHTSLRDVDESALRSELGIASDSIVFTYVGRIYQAKRVDLLVSAVRHLRELGIKVEAVVVGGGPSLAGLQAIAADAEGVHVVGEILDQARVARYLRVSAAVVIPGAVGLSVNHSLAHGRPVITRAANPHGPEIEFVEHDVSGLIVPGDVRAFEQALIEYATSPERQNALRRGALLARERLGLDEMVEAFDMAVRKVFQ